MGVFGRTGSRGLRRVGRGRGESGGAVGPWGQTRVGRGRGESGGAISLWVLLMVPVSGFAAVVAMAGPQRVSAESTMQDAADDLAMLAVAWRDGQGINPDDMEAGPLYAFPPECSTDAQPTHYDPRIEFHESEVEKYQAQIDGLPSGDPLIPGLQLLLDAEQVLLDPLLISRIALREDWRKACDLLFESLFRDLGYLGVDMNSLRGFYSDSLSMSSQPEKPQCLSSEYILVEDAVHVVLAADWQDAGWAAAQVWPDGTRVAAESMGRISHRVAAPPAAVGDCDGALTVLDSRGRPVLEPTAKSRGLSRSVARTSLSG